MFELIYKDVVLARGTMGLCKRSLETAVRLHGNLEFWQEISQRKRTDYIYYDKNNPECIITYTILPT